MRDLKKDADTVAHLATGIFSGPVFKLFNDLQRLIYDLVAFCAVDLYDAPIPQASCSFIVNCILFLLKLRFPRSWTNSVQKDR